MFYFQNQLSEIKINTHEKWHEEEEDSLSHGTDQKNNAEWRGHRKSEYVSPRCPEQGNWALYEGAGDFVHKGGEGEDRRQWTPHSHKGKGQVQIPHRKNWENRINPKLYVFHCDQLEHFIYH